MTLERTGEARSEAPPRGVRAEEATEEVRGEALVVTIATKREEVGAEARVAGIEEIAVAEAGGREAEADAAGEAEEEDAAATVVHGAEVLIEGVEVGGVPHGEVAAAETGRGAPPGTGQDQDAEVAAEAGEPAEDRATLLRAKTSALWPFWQDHQRLLLRRRLARRLRTCRLPLLSRRLTCHRRLR